MYFKRYLYTTNGFMPTSTVLRKGTKNKNRKKNKARRQFKFKLRRQNKL
jgi:hypothetical protein